MNLKWSEIVTGTLAIYVASARSATAGLRRNWVIIPGIVGLYLAFVFLSFALGSLGMLGGFLVSLFALAALTLYYNWLSQTVTRQRVRMVDLKEFDVALFFGIISVSFVLWIASLLVESVAMGAQMPGLQLLLSLFIIFACNATPEVLYLNRAESVHALLEAFRFVRDNAIEWYLPFILLSLPFLSLGFDVFVIQFASSYPLLPISMVMEAPRALISGEFGILAAGLGVILAHWFMLFRAHLFQELSRGTRRQRAFAARQA